MPCQSGKESISIKLESRNMWVVIGGLVKEQASKKFTTSDKSLVRDDGYALAS